MSKRISVEGKTYVVPDDATDDEITEIVGGPSRDFAANPPGMPVPPYKTQKVDTMLTPHEFGERFRSAGNPGVSEGAGLREGLGEWTGEVGSNLGGGVKDVATGNFSRGAHKLISGAGTALMPTLPFVAAAAPAATARALIAGPSAGYIAGRGAAALGASPDQSDLAGDVGGFVGGGVAAGGIPNGVRQPIGKVLQFASDVVDPEVVGLVSPRLSHLQKLASRAGARLGTEATPEIAAPVSHSADQVPGVPYAPRPRAYRASPTVVGPSRPGLMLPGEVAPPPVASVASPVSAPVSTEVGEPSLIDSIRERRGVSAPPDLPQYTGPERRVAAPAPEDLGFDWSAPEDIGNKTRVQIEKKMGPIKRGGAGPIAWPPEGPGPVIERPHASPLSPKEDALETRALQEQVRSKAEGEDFSRLSQARREWFARNAPAEGKGSLLESARRNLKAGPPPGTSVPQTSEETQDLLDQMLNKTKKTKR